MKGMWPAQKQQTLSLLRAQTGPLFHQEDWLFWVSVPVCSRPSPLPVSPLPCHTGPAAGTGQPNPPEDGSSAVLSLGRMVTVTWGESDAWPPPPQGNVWAEWHSLELLRRGWRVVAAGIHCPPPGFRASSTLPPSPDSRSPGSCWRWIRFDTQNKANMSSLA